MKTIDMEKTGENIDQMRKKSGMSVSAIMDTIGISSPNSFYKWIHGKSMPTIDNLVMLADIFGCGIGDIVATKVV